MATRLSVIQLLRNWIEKIAANANTTALDSEETTALGNTLDYLQASLPTPSYLINVPSTGHEISEDVSGTIYLNVPVTLEEAVLTIPSVTLPQGYNKNVKFVIKFVPDETVTTFTIEDALTLWGTLQVSLFAAPVQLSMTDFQTMDYLQSIKTQTWPLFAALVVRADLQTSLFSVGFLNIVYPSIQTPIIPVPTVSEKTDTTAKIAGTFIYTGLKTITEVGIVLGQTGEADIEVPDSGITSPFSVDLSNLEDDIVYAISSYIKFEDGTGATSDFGFFSAKDIPNVTTAAASVITEDSATAGGTFVYEPADGVGAITEVGVDWKIAGGAFAEAVGVGTSSPFTVAISSLTNDSSYVLKAYVKTATNKYSGAEVTFATKEVPVVTTTAASAITAVGASTGGTYVYDPVNGIGAITEVGIEWKIDGGAYVAIAGGTIESPFVSALADLTPSSLYHVKAYVKIGTDTYYGNEVNFNTLGA